MQILQLVGIGLTATVIAVVLRERAPQFAMLVGLLTGVVLFLAVIGPMQDVVRVLQDLAQAAHVDQGFLGTVLKIIGIAYIVEFAAQVARDAHEGALAGKIELVGKVGIVVLALPIVTGVVESLVHLLP
ncbi:stage III sporulation protein AD [Alicyclobacillus sp.]|uniref:stage III sporulation protein AD n=1 Tax=Alicyclobacillus sp. TaxID=61169 RepID=UPI0025C2475C|nr:stage III sporulation protein AD [Alicyclobacillus sp.]MCL6516190.1 stage III sporulation protein AD [Alicyclobacillus sp.]